MDVGQSCGELGLTFCSEEANSCGGEHPGHDPSCVQAAQRDHPSSSFIVKTALKILDGPVAVREPVNQKHPRKIAMYVRIGG